MLLCRQPVKTETVPNRVLGASPPNTSTLESLLPWSVHTTLAQLRSGHCRLLNAYKARITTGMSDVCPECGVAPHSIEHLFNCRTHPMQLTVQDLCDNPAAVADFLNLYLMITVEKRRTAGISQQQHQQQLKILVVVK